MVRVFLFVIGVCFAEPLFAGLPANLVCTFLTGGSQVDVPFVAQTNPYSVLEAEVGSRFQYSGVYFSGLAGPAHLKMAVRFSSDEGWRPLHTAVYSGFEGFKKGQRFTGLQKVYEPVTLAEIQYWCEVPR